MHGPLKIFVTLFLTLFFSCFIDRVQQNENKITIGKSLRSIRVFLSIYILRFVRSLLKNLHDKNLRTKSNKFTIYFLHRNHKQVKYSYLMVKVHTQETDAPWPGKEEIPAKPGGLGAVGHVPFFNMGI